MAYKKVLPCLKINTTSRIESINAIIEQEINSSSRITELFYRLLNIAKHRLNTTYPDNTQINQEYLKNLEKNSFLLNYKEKLSPYAYEQLALNFGSVYSFNVKLYKGIYKIVWWKPI